MCTSHYSQFSLRMEQTTFDGALRVCPLVKSPYSESNTMFISSKGHWTVSSYHFRSQLILSIHSMRLFCYSIIPRIPNMPLYCLFRIYLKAVDCPTVYFAGTNQLLCQHRLNSVTKKDIKEKRVPNSIGNRLPLERFVHLLKSTLQNKKHLKLKQKAVISIKYVCGLIYETEDKISFKSEELKI